MSATTSGLFRLLPVVKALPTCLKNDYSDHFLIFDTCTTVQHLKTSIVTYPGQYKYPLAMANVSDVNAPIDFV